MIDEPVHLEKYNLSGSTSLLKYSVAKSAIVNELILLAQLQRTDK